MSVEADRPPLSASGKAPAEILDFLKRASIVSADTRLHVVPLPGGVSSDIYRVEIEAGPTLCVKRALGKLKVAADWRAPVERNRYEVAWLREAAAIVPEAVPPLIADDAEAGVFAMAYLPPDRYPVWKAQLGDGTIERATAAQVGDVLGRIHAATADRPEVASRFATDTIFLAIRIEPYLLATARAHPELAAELQALAETTARTRRVLVHGDFSPKNLLIGPNGPVVLDAECAWFGEPAFDVAFVLNHLLLKGAWRAQWRARYLHAFDALVDSYRRHVHWEPWQALEARTARLLPGLMLARIDGKSPVEYLSREDERALVRSFASRLLREPVDALAAIGARWGGAA